MKSVSNILAGEFLVDVKEICDASADDDISQLQIYLLQGRGNILLRVLNTVGVQGLSSARELGDLLVSLLPLCCRFQALEGHDLPDVALKPMTDCFTHLTNVPVKQHQPKFPTVTAVASKKCSNRSFTTRQLERSAKLRAAQSSSDSETESDQAQQQWPQYRTDGLYPLSTGGGLGVFPGMLQEDKSSDEDPEQDDDPIEHVKKLTPIEITLLILNLAKNLCDREGIGGEHGMAVSLALLPHLSHFLSTIHEDSKQGNFSEGWNADLFGYVKRAAVRVIISVSSHATLQPNGISALAASGAIVALLEIAKQSLRTVKEWDDLTTQAITYCSSPILLADDVLYGMWLLIHTIFYSIPRNTTYLNSSLKLMIELVEAQGLYIVNHLLLVWEKLYEVTEETSTESGVIRLHLGNVVSALGKVMSSLKNAKVSYIHTMLCTKKRHNNCDFKEYTDHHHDVLGVASSAMFDSQQTSMTDSYGSAEALDGGINAVECAAAILTTSLLELFAESKSKLLQVRLLNCIEEVGVCCCVPPSSIMKHLLRPLKSQSPGLRNLTLSVLATCLLKGCGGSASQQASIVCLMCNDCAKSKMDTVRMTSSEAMLKKPVKKKKVPTATLR